MKREDFDLDDGMIYLNHAAIGPLPTRSLALLEESYTGFAQKGEASLDFDAMIQLWNDTRKSIADLVQGDPSGVTITTNTASGLHIVADGMHRVFRQGGNIVITELEFTTNSFVWQQLARRYHLDLHIVKYNEVTKKLEGWQDHITNTTRLVSLSHVQFSNGYRQPLEEIVEYAHDHGALVNLDSIQALGIVPFDAQKSQVDFISAGGYKWLLGPLGSGVFYANLDSLTRLDSMLVGWFSSQNFHDMVHNTFQPWDDARRFQQSLSPLFGALKSSIDLVNSWGIRDTYAHVTSLHDIIIEMLESHPQFTIVSNIEPEHRSGILTIKHDNAEQLVEKLHQENMVVAFRDGNIRIAPHAYSTSEEVVQFTQRLIELG